MRTNCSGCKRLAAPSEEQWADARRQFADDGLFDRLNPSRDRAQVATAKGCHSCSGTGYLGHLGLHELLVIDDDLRRLIHRRAQSAEIRAEALKRGLITLKQDGVRKVLAGVTDLNEVRAVCMK